MELAKVFGVVLREHRLRLDLTQEQLAFEAEIRRTYVSMLELGQHQPTLTMLFALGGALKCPPSQLLAEVESRLELAHQAHSKKKPVLPRRRVKSTNDQT